MNLLVVQDSKLLATIYNWTVTNLVVCAIAVHFYRLNSTGIQMLADLFDLKKQTKGQTKTKKV